VRRYLGLDLGGTNVKVAVLEIDEEPQSPRLVAASTHATYAERGPQGVVDRLIEVGRSAIAEHGPVEFIGVGVPGIFDPDAGTIVLFPNLPGPWEGHAVRDPIATALEVPVTVINDARAFVLAEGTVGAGRGARTLIGITLGTGIGGGIMIDGRLRLGSFGRGGEIAHQIVLPDGPECGCGNRGCAEALARADVLAEMGGKATVEEVYRGAEEGDERCRRAIHTAAKHLGIALANAVTLLGPERIVVGGGISAAGDVVLDPLRAAVRARVTLVPVDEIDIVVAELGSGAGAIGAALAGLFADTDA
jgi:glucokinase